MTNRVRVPFAFLFEQTPLRVRRMIIAGNGESGSDPSSPGEVTRNHLLLSRNVGRGGSEVLSMESIARDGITLQ